MNAATIKHYAVAVETGSCSLDTDDLGDGYDQQHRWEERTTCGHKHKTREAAKACLAKLTKRDQQGRCSALWHNATIHDQDGHRV